MALMQDILAFSSNWQNAVRPRGMRAYRYEWPDGFGVVHSVCHCKSARRGGFA